MQTAFLDQPVSRLRFVSAQRAAALAKMGIVTVRDLLENYPHRYLDMTQMTHIVDCTIGSTVTVVGTVGEVRIKTPKPRMTIVEISLLDGTGVLFGSWFKQPWIADKIHAGDRVMFSGKVEFNFGFKRMNAPFLEVITTADERAESMGAPADGEDPASGRVIPLHPLTAGVSGAWMRRFVATALEQADSVLDDIPSALRIKHALCSRATALSWIHFPATLAQAQAARCRLSYGELLRLQLFLLMRHERSITGLVPFVHHTSGLHLEALRHALPFTLTVEQDCAIETILSDMAASRIMNRMLLGDVGTGKTVVAAHAIAAAVDSGNQACMMAPTTVLAQQYASKLGPLLEGAGINWALLTGATSAQEREEILERLSAGILDVVFGTHALIQPDVTFKNLSLVIIDEQHRFGVDQRSALRAKGAASDLLVMTATPIPRTLALSLYGDLDCSYIRNRPRATAPTTTHIIRKADRAQAYDAIRACVAAGRQAYIVCPLVGVKQPQGDDTEALAMLDASIEDGVDVSNAAAAEKEASFLGAKVFPEMRVGLLTGRMASKQKIEVMERFRAGEIDVLVSTTVIEVGVDVPNATVMMIEDANRFGLSQLHQLRGRIGRGEHPGTLYLVATVTGDARQRLEALASTNDGLELAEFDLKLRKEGDILGSRQHGMAALKLVDVVRDTELITAAHADARELLGADPLLEAPEHTLLAREVALVAGRSARDTQGG